MAAGLGGDGRRAPGRGRADPRRGPRGARDVPDLRRPRRGLSMPPSPVAGGHRAGVAAWLRRALGAAPALRPPGAFDGGPGATAGGLPDALPRRHPRRPAAAAVHVGAQVHGEHVLLPGRPAVPRRLRVGARPAAADVADGCSSCMACVERGPSGALGVLTRRRAGPCLSCSSASTSMSTSTSVLSASQLLGFVRRPRPGPVGSPAGSKRTL